MTRIVLLLLALASPAVADPSTPSGGAVTTQPAPDKKPDKKTVKKKKKKKKKKDDEAPPEQPKDEPPPIETTKIEPELVYRAAVISPVGTSVYHKKSDLNQEDQLYLTLLFSKTYNYVHQVVVQPVIRTLPTSPTQYDTELIQQAYLESAVTDRVGVTVGKKAEFDGPGFIVNPSDLLNEGRQVFDPLYQNDGVVFTRVKTRLGENSSVGVGYIPLRGRSTHEGSFWMTGSTDLLGADIHGQMTVNAVQKTTEGLSVQRFFGSNYELHFDGRYQSRARNQVTGDDSYWQFSSASGNDATIYADDVATAYFLTGTRYVFTSKRSLILEYIDNQAGLLPGQFHDFFANLKSEEKGGKSPPSAPTQLEGRLYGFISYQDDETIPSSHLGVNYLRNLQDGSSFAALSLVYNLSPLTSVELAPTFFTGPELSEFGEMPFSQLIYLNFRGKF